MNRILVRFGLLSVSLLLAVVPGFAESFEDETYGENRRNQALFEPENLMAWCIVPFDSAKRSPKERAKMLRELGIPKLAYDYRAEHVPTFEEEILAMKEEGIDIYAWWFPSELNDEAKGILKLFSQHQIRPQIWVMGHGDVNMSPEDEAKFVAGEVKRLQAIADAGREVGCNLGLYNHGGWFGVPENMIRLIREIDRPNVGIVYNLHHAHDQLHRLPEVLALLKPHMIALNVNGMETDGESVGKKILVIGAGDQDEKVFESIWDSGYQGTIGILNHTDEDARTRLQANLDGLKKLADKLRKE